MIIQRTGSRHRKRKHQLFVYIPKAALDTFGWKHKTKLMYKIDTQRKEIIIRKEDPYFLADMWGEWITNHWKKKEKPIEKK